MSGVIIGSCRVGKRGIRYIILFINVFIVRIVVIFESLIVFEFFFLIYVVCIFRIVSILYRVFIRCSRVGVRYIGDIIIFIGIRYIGVSVVFEFFFVLICSIFVEVVIIFWIVFVGDRVLIFCDDIVRGFIGNVIKFIGISLIFVSRIYKVFFVSVN